MLEVAEPVTVLLQQDVGDLPGVSQGQYSWPAAASASLAVGSGRYRRTEATPPAGDRLLQGRAPVRHEMGGL
jgi:hypothetical protein